MSILRFLRTEKETIRFEEKKNILQEGKEEIKDPYRKMPDSRPNPFVELLKKYNNLSVKLNDERDKYYKKEGEKIQTFLNEIVPYLNDSLTINHDLFNSGVFYLGKDGKMSQSPYSIAIRMDFNKFEKILTEALKFYIQRTNDSLFNESFKYQEREFKVK